jgi:hypothetical protein
MLTHQVLDPNKYSYYPGLGEMNPLSLACLQHDYEIVDLLLKSPKIRVDSTDKHGRTALQNACMQCSIPMMKKLLEAGANCNTVDDQCCSPLIHAVMWNLPEGVALLLAHGALVHPKNAEKLSALGIAQKYVLPSVELVNMLQAADKDPDSIKTHFEPQEWPLNQFQAFIMTCLTILTVGLVYIVIKAATYVMIRLSPSDIFSYILSFEAISLGLAIKVLLTVSAGFGLGLAICKQLGGGVTDAEVRSVPRRHY